MFRRRQGPNTRNNQTLAGDCSSNGSGLRAVFSRVCAPGPGERLVGISVSDSFGSLLRWFRVSAGLTQEALASLSGVSARGIRLLESDRRKAPRLETVRLLSVALKLDDDQHRSLLHAARPDLARDTSEVANAAAAYEPDDQAPERQYPGSHQCSRRPREHRRGHRCSMTGGTTRLLTITGPPGLAKRGSARGKPETVTGTG